MGGEVNFFLIRFSHRIYSYSFFNLLATPHGLRELGSQAGVKPASPALEMQSLSHWTAREAPAKACELDAAPSIYFCFGFPCLRRHIQKNTAKTNVKE